MRTFFGFLLFGLVTFAGCQKVRPLDYEKSHELKAGDISPTISFEAATVTRSATVSVVCDSPCDAYVFIGPVPEETTALLGSGKEPKSGTVHAKAGSKTGDATFDVEPNKEFSVILRNPGMKKISAQVKIHSAGK